MTETTSKPSAAHASVCNTSERNVATRSISSACSEAVTWVSILKIASTPLVRVAKYSAGLVAAPWCASVPIAIIASRTVSPLRLEWLSSDDLEGLVRLKRLAHRLVHLACEDLHQNGVPIQPLRLIGCPALGGGHGDAKTTSVGQRLAQLRPLVDEHLDQVLLVEIRIAGQVGHIAHVCDQRDDAGDHVRMPGGAFLCRQALRRCPGDRGSRCARPSISLSCATRRPAAGRLRLPS